MSQFIETIRIENGKIDLLDYHNDRFNTTRKLFFCVEDEWDLKHFIDLPEKYKKGSVKCRIVFDNEIRELQFSFYIPRKIQTLQLVNASINYSFKSTDRNQLELLKQLGKPADEVLIVNNGKISDTSYSNIIFRKKGKWYTPNSPLLAGVQREYLLNKALIEECSISPADLCNFDAFMLINAMIRFNETDALPIQNILPL